jgi:hypothetical protein
MIDPRLGLTPGLGSHILSIVRTLAQGWVEDGGRIRWKSWLYEVRAKFAWTAHVHIDIATIPR